MNLGWLANNWGKMGIAAAKGNFGRTIQGAAIGAVAGGVYGAMSSNTSVLGGVLMGAGLGAGGMRYGSSAYRKGWKGAAATMRRDYRGASVFTNKIGNSIRGLHRYSPFRGIGGGI